MDRCFVCVSTAVKVRLTVIRLCDWNVTLAYLGPLLARDTITLWLRKGGVCPVFGVLYLAGPFNSRFAVRRVVAILRWAYY